MLISYRLEVRFPALCARATSENTRLGYRCLQFLGGCKEFGLSTEL